MNDLYLTSNELDECLDQYLLTLPTVFDECMSPEQQILWLLIHKQNLLVEGDNITLTPNEDGTVTISSEASGATYTIETATPDEGYTAAYILKNVDTGEQAGAKIQVPTVAGPQGPAGPQGETGPQGPQGEEGEPGAEGNGIESISIERLNQQYKGLPTAINPGDPDIQLSANTSYQMNNMSVDVGTRSTYIDDYSVTVEGAQYTSRMRMNSDGTTLNIRLNYESAISLILITSFVAQTSELQLLDNNDVLIESISPYAPAIAWARRVTFATTLNPGDYKIRLYNSGSNTYAYFFAVLGEVSDPISTTVTITETDGTVTSFEVPDGKQGATGSQGATGPAGPGVPAGGTVGQVLKKSGSGDYETNWEDPSGGGFDPEYITYVSMYNYNASSPASGISNISVYGNYNYIDYIKTKPTQDTYAYASGIDAHIMLSFRSTAQQLNTSNIEFCTLTGQNVYSQTLYGTNNANTPLLNRPMLEAEILDNTGTVIGRGRAELNFTTEKTVKITFRPFINSISLTSGVTYYLHIY